MQHEIAALVGVFADRHVLVFQDQNHAVVSETLPDSTEGLDPLVRQDLVSDAGENNDVMGAGARGVHE